MLQHTTKEDYFLCEWHCILLALTLDKQVTGRADSSRLIGSCAGEAAAVFSECFTDHQSGKSVLVGDLEINGALNLVVLSEPHNDGGGMTADLALQGHRLALDHICVLQSLHKKISQHLYKKVSFPKQCGHVIWGQSTHRNQRGRDHGTTGRRHRSCLHHL